MAALSMTISRKDAHEKASFTLMKVSLAVPLRMFSATG